MKVDPHPTSAHEAIARIRAIEARQRAMALKVSARPQPRVIEVRHREYVPGGPSLAEIAARIMAMPVPPKPAPEPLPVRRMPVWYAEAARVPPDARPEGTYPVVLLLRIAAEAGGVTVEDIRGPRQFGRLIRPRQLFCWLARRFGPAHLRSLPAIGRQVRRDHTTVLSSIRKVDRAVALHGAPATDDPRAWAEFLIARHWPGGRS